MTEKRRAPESVCRDLCEAVTVAQNRGWTLPDVVEEQWNAYIAATAPLRTRAEVDAEIANLCRDKWTLPRPIDLEEVSRINKRIEELCREPTTDEPSPTWRTGTKNPRVLYDGDEMIGSMDTPDLAKRVVRAVTGTETQADPLVDRVLASDEPEPEKCGCDESDALRDEVSELRQLLDYARRTAQDIVTVLEEARK